LSEFIIYFEADYNLWLEECKDILEKPEDQLNDEDKMIKKEQLHFMKQMYE